MNLFVYTPFGPAERTDLLAHLPADVFTTFRTDETEPPAPFRNADVLLGNPPPDWLAQAPALRWWQLDSAGFDKYQAVQTTATVSNVGDYFAWPCAETIVAGVLALYRRVHELAVRQTRREWVGAALRPSLALLRGKRTVILGAGTIGQAVAQMLAGFGCPVQFLARTDPAATLRSADDLRHALPQTDLVINTLPGSARGFFTADLVAAMPPGSVFANVGRGSTVDEPALIAALRSGRIGGAVLDVTDTEPLPPDSPLWTLPNVILTQHTGGGSATEDRGKVELFLRNLERFRRGETPGNVVELARGY